MKKRRRTRRKEDRERQEQILHIGKTLVAIEKQLNDTLDNLFAILGYDKK